MKTIPTEPFSDQKPGTSGLRKLVKVFQQENYTENFVQAIFGAIPTGAKNSSILVGGDGRYFSKEAIQIIVKIAAGNGVSKLVIGQNGILSTPAASNIIRKRGLTGGILLTASHNPGGPDADFGIKYNMGNGGPAPEAITDRIYELAKNLNEYYTAEIDAIDLATIGIQKFGDLEVEIIDSVNDYVELMREIFDFDAIKNFISHTPSFTFLFDAMHAVTGPYAIQVFCKELGIPESSIINAQPKPDFNGGHPDPNLTYAHELVELVEKHSISFGAASDGDGDRNMIIGKVIAARANIIPYFKKTGIKGLARSMPTSSALDCVAHKLGYKIFEVPTGWKFFGNLMDSNQLSICGEESFGTGSDHIREKDGLWAILAWLSIVADANEKNPGSTLQDILNEHYAIYGRNYFSRYDFEDVDADGAAKMMEKLRKLCLVPNFVGSNHGEFQVKIGEDFKYTDPIDGSISIKQGVRILFTDGSRIIYRLSGTGSQGATIRMYIEKYDSVNVQNDTAEALKSLIEIAFKISDLKKFTGRSEPTVIT